MPPKVHTHLLLVLYLLLQLLHSTILLANPTIPDHYTLRSPSPAATGPQEYLDPTYPPPLLPSGPPSCVLPVLRHSFADTYGRPPATAAYSPPCSCRPPWRRVVLAFSAHCAGDQYDRVAAVWLDGAELLRTTTAEPTPAGIFWNVRKDITRFSALLRRPRSLAVMLENVVNDVYTGVYHVNVSLEFYKTAGILQERLDLSLPVPADLVVPISEASGGSGFWFRIQNASDVRSKRVVVPRNTYRVLLEVCVSYHSDDEFWYSNPPNSYIKENNLTTGRGNAAFREVVVSVDGHFAGSIVPFPVIFTGGINPLFWQPVVALGAFDLPSYDLDLTPFLGLLLDGKPHEIRIGVADGISVWLVDANLHLWLDPNSESVAAKLVQYPASRISLSRQYSFLLLDGKFKIRAERRSFFSGWVSSSLGNLTTEVHRELKFESLVEFTNDGKDKIVEMKAKQKAKSIIRSNTGMVIAKRQVKAKYPLRIVALTVPGEDNTYTSRTNLSHAFHEKIRNSFNNTDSFCSLSDLQDAEGWMLVQDHSVLSGSAGTQQEYQYHDDNGFYRRMVSARNGVILSDNTTENPGFAMW